MFPWGPQARRGKSISPATRQEVADRSRGLCEADLEMCIHRAEQIHHKKYTARGGTHNPINLLHVCGPCHEAIHAHQAGTERFRTLAYQTEGESEEDVAL